LTKYTEQELAVDALITAAKQIVGQIDFAIARGFINPNDIVTTGALNRIKDAIERIES